LVPSIAKDESFGLMEILLLKEFFFIIYFSAVGIISRSKLGLTKNCLIGDPKCGGLCCY
jgi:hypothetical protein